MLFNSIENQIPKLASVEQAFATQNIKNENSEDLLEGVKAPTFLDVFKNIVNNAVDTNAQKQTDMLNLMLGDTDNLDVITANITKAEVATELLVTVKNSIVDSYNEIIRMSI